MSIASEITRITNNVAAAYTAASGKGATLPATQNSANLADTITSIPSGGGGGDSGGEFLVAVIDYDGTVIKQDHLNTGATFELPEVPTHNRLTFEKWSSPVVITDNKITVSNSDIIIGPMYKTTSNLDEFDITLNAVTGLTVTLNVTGDKDWGDGTSDNLTSHTYTDYGDYMITCNSTSFNGAYNKNIFATSSGQQNQYVTAIRLAHKETYVNIKQYSFYLCTSLKYITIPTGFYLSSGQSQHFASCRSLKAFIIPTDWTILTSNINNSNYALGYVVIPYGITIIAQNNFYNCCNLKAICIPSSVSTIDTYALTNCYNLKKVVLPNTITSLGNTAFSGLYNVNKIKVSKNITTIDSSTFAYCYNAEEFDFTEHTSVPTLNNTNAFINIPSLCKIKVPAALYSSWITASNWSTYANQIVSV